jgi:hypothetical protein
MIGITIIIARVRRSRLTWRTSLITIAHIENLLSTRVDFYTR